MARERILFLIGAVVLGAGLVLFLLADHTVEFISSESPVGKLVETVKQAINPNADIGPQPQLENPPALIKALYATGYSAGSEKKVAYFMNLLETTELNAIVIDIKDYTGLVSYEPEVALVKEYGAWEKKIPKINFLIKRLHDAGVYVIGRIAVFQDQALTKARPELALRSSSTGAVWTDYKKVAWLDTAAQPVWDYNIAIVQEALARGFDEINFDYIRFASDGNIKDIVYPYFDTTTLKHNTLKKFFAYLRQQLPASSSQDGPKARFSADLFGLVTEDSGDMGIGQHLEDAFPYFDAIAPMAYPSHYAKGHRGFSNPAEHPYEVMKYAIEAAIGRITTYNLKLITDNQKINASSTNSNASSSSLSVISNQLLVRSKLRPWIQDFDLGADYTADKVRAQIQAVYDSDCVKTASSSAVPFDSAQGKLTTSSISNGVNPAPCSASVQGWMLWSPSNVYTKEALLTE